MLLVKYLINLLLDQYFLVISSKTMKSKHPAIVAAFLLLNLGLLTSCSKSSIPVASTSGTAPDTKSTPVAKDNANSVGGPLAQKLQGKPVIVDIYASWCAACKNIAPTISQLRDKYAGKVEFVVLDVSDRATTTQAETTAKELGLSSFLTSSKAQTGSLAIIDPANGKILSQHHNNPDLVAYTKVLDPIVAK
jgi:thiol-disulfide isomerase/thioredoxin